MPIWNRGKNKDSLELKEEERELGLKLGPIQMGRKRIYQKRKEEASNIQEVSRHEPCDEIGLKKEPPNNKEEPEKKESVVTVVNVQQAEKVIEKNMVFEDRVTISPGKYETVELGTVNRGVKIVIEANEIFGEKFSIYIFDKDNLKKYRKENVTKGAVWSGTNHPDYLDEVVVKRTSDLFLVVTSKAYEKKRTIWYHLEICSLSI